MWERNPVSFVYSLDDFPYWFSPKISASLMQLALGLALKKLKLVKSNRKQTAASKLFEYVGRINLVSIF